MRQNFRGLLCILAIIWGGITQSTATVYYVSGTLGSNANTSTQAQDPSTPWQTVSFAITQAANGDTVFVLSGVYTETGIVINKRIKLLGNTLDLPAGTGVKPVFAGVSSLPNASIFLVQNTDIEIRNFNLRVDQTFVIRGIFAPGPGFARLVIADNLIESSNSAGPLSSVFNSYGIQLGQLTTPASNTDSFTIVRNVVQPRNEFSSKFGRGIRIVGGFGRIGGVNLSDSNRVFGDYGLQIGSIVGGRLQVLNNHCYGSSAAIEVNFLAGNRVHLIQRNKLETWRPGLSLCLLEIKNNTVSQAGNPSVINVFNNEFLGFTRYGVFSTRSRNVFLHDNIFLPNDTSSFYAHVVINTKQQTAANDAPTTSGISILRNQFDGNSNANADGSGIVIQNHNSDNNPAFENVIIGTPGNENRFASSIKSFVFLDTASGPSNAIPIWDNPAYAISTTKPVNENFNLSNNLFDVGTGLKLPSAMSNDELLLLEDKIAHKIDFSELGFCTVVPNKVYVTPNSFITNKTASASLQRAFDAANNGWEIVAASGAYPNPANFNKSVDLNVLPTNGTAVIPELVLNTPSLVVNLTGGNLQIDNIMTLDDGIINVNSANVSSFPGVIINGGNAGSFFHTNGAGGFRYANVTSQPVVFPVGLVTGLTSNSVYAPVTIANSGTMDFYTLRVSSNVLTNPNGGTPVDSVVGITYTLNENTPGGGNLNFTFNYPGSEEKVGFNRGSIALQGFDGSSWVNLLPAFAAATGTDPFTVSFTGVTEEFSNRAIRLRTGQQSVGNIYYVDDDTGDDTRSNLEARNPNTPWRTIAKALSSVDDGDTIQVFEGFYNESNLDINKSVKLFGNVVGIGTGVGAGTGIRPTVSGALAGPDSTVFRLRAPGVVIKNFEIAVDQNDVKYGIHARSAGYNGVQILNNRIISTGTNPNPPTDPCLRFNTMGILLAGNGLDTFTIKGNFIEPALLDGTICVFGRGIRARGAFGTIGGLAPEDSNRFLSFYGAQIIVPRGPIKIYNNFFVGEALEINSPVANSGNHIVEGNRFRSAFPQFFVAQVEIKNNTNAGSNIIIRNNVFREYSNIGLLSTRSRNVTVTNNTFTPSDTAANFRHISINTKQRTLGTNQPPTQNSITITSNTFNCLNNNGAGVAIEFANHNDDPNANEAFTGVQIGGTGALANTFGPNHNTFLRLDENNGPSNSLSVWSIFPSTPMAPVADNFDMSENIYFVSATGKRPADMDIDELYALEDKIQHGIDLGSLGFATTKANEAYVTNNSFVAPLTSTPSLQRAHDKISDGFTVFAQPASFSDGLIGNKTFTLATSPGGATSISSLTLDGAGKTITTADSIIVRDALTMNAGFLNLNGGSLVLEAPATVSGGSAASFVNTSGQGYVTHLNLAGSKLYPIGINNSYNPLTLNNTGTANNVGVRLVNDVFDNGLSGAPVDTVVNKTWLINESAPGSSQLTGTFGWSAANEKAGFDRNNIFVEGFFGTWQNIGSTNPVSALGTDPFTVQSSLSGSFINTPVRLISTQDTTPVGNIYYVDDDTGDDTRSNIQARNPNTPWRTIAKALASVSNGDSVQVFDGTYFESNLNINKSVKLFGNVVGIGTGAGAGNGIRPIVNGNIAGADSTIFSLNAPNVLIQNFELPVNQTTVKFGIRAKSGNFDGVQIIGNRITSVGSNPSPPTNPCVRFNTFGIFLSTGGNDKYTLKSNFIEPGALDGTICVFGRGIRIKGGHGEIGGSAAADSNRVLAFYGAQIADIRGGQLVVRNNFFVGEALEINNPSANTGQHLVEQNRFFGVFPQFFAAQVEIKNFVENGTDLLVQNNLFSGFSNYGLLSTRSRNVAVRNNIFTPVDTAQNFRHIGVNTKQRTISVNQPPFESSISITGNTFNAPVGTPKGTGIEFANHNDDPNTTLAFGNVVIGGAGALANTFNGNHKNVVALDAQAGPSNNFLLFANLPATNMQPVADNFDVQENLFNVSGGVKRPADMTVGELYELENQIQHGIDFGALGFVTVKPNEAYVTENSFLAPLTTVPSLQRAHDKAIDGFTIYTQPETFSVALSNAKDLTLITNPSGRVSLPGLELFGAGKSLVIGDTLVLTDSLKLTAGFVNLVGGTMILKDGIAISGGSDVSFIRTDANPGFVWHENVSGTPKLYPIGINSSYNPLSLSNTGTPDNVAVRLVNDVFENGLNGASVPQVVDKTWVINEGTPGGSELIATFNWTGANEKAGFDRTQIYIDAYRASWVNVSGTTALTATGSDPYAVVSSISGSYTNTPVRISNVPLVLGNLYYVDIITGDDSRSNAEAQNPNTPWRTIANALARVDHGDSIQVFDGTYNESDLFINKRIKLFGNVIGVGTGVGAGTGTRPVINGTVPGVDSTIFRLAATNVLIQNFEILVDQQNILHGIYGKNGGYNNLELLDNRIVSAGANPNTSTICVPFNTYGIRLIGGNGDSITLKRNEITPQAITINNCGFERGIRLLGNHALIGGSPADSNTIVALFGIQAEDIRGGKLTIRHNLFLGGGIEVNSPAANTGQHLIENNFFDVVLAPLFLAHVEVKNIQNNGTSLRINNNIFRGHAFTSIFSTRSRNVFVTNNTFIPSDTSRNYRHISVNTKQRTVAAVQNPDVPNEIVITGNIFGGRTSGLEGIAIEFANHNDNPNSETAFSNVVIGGPGPLANIFLDGIKHYFALDFRSGPTSSIPVWNNLPVTQMAPVADNFDLRENIFFVAGGNKLPADMTDNELYEIENKVQHGIDFGALGFATVKSNFAFVTNNSFLAPLTTTPSLQRAHNKAQNGWTINVQPDNFNEVVRVSKTLTFDAVPSDSISVKGLSMQGTSVPVAKLTLLDPFTVTDSLSLDNPLGGKVFIGDNNFFVSSSAISTGGQDSCYIVTNGLGDLVKRGIGSQSFRFNVGTVSSFAPLGFADNNNTPDNFRVKVKPKANSTDFNPALPAQAAAFVKFQWEICEDQAGGSNAQLIFDWRDNIENVFGVASILNVVGRSTGTEWVPRVIPQIVTSSTGLSNVTEFCAPFAVYYDSLFNTVVIDTVLNLSNGAAVNAFCTGDSIEIRYRVFRQLVFGNTFTAFLYNSNGDSILIGSKIDNQSGSMFLTIPTTATVDNCSKIRIFSSTPASIGEFNRSCLRIRRTPIPPVINVSGTFDFCQGETRTLSVTGGVSYLWTPTNETTGSITVSVAGQYAVLLTDTSGCSVSSDTVALVVKPKPVKPQIQIVSGTNPFCEGASVTLGIVDSLANTIYTWQPGGPVITVAGTYFLIADSTNGCRDSSAAFVATTVTAPDTFSVQVAPEPQVCEGTSITLTAPAGFTYQWAGIPGLPITTQTANVSVVGAYSATVTITNASGCSRTSNVANIAVRKAPTKPRIDTTLGTRYCNGTQVNLSAIPFTASNTYTFSPSQTFTINANTQVFVRVDSNNCSVTSDTVLFINNPLPPAFSLSATPNDTVCEGTTVTISGPAGLFTYLWSGVTPNPGNVQSINLTAAGFYPVNLTIRDSVTKCLRTANQLLNIRINVNPAVPTITVSQGSVPFCEGQSATLAPVPFSANNTYTFIGGGPVVNAPGVITVMVDSTNGCSSTSAPFEVTVNPLPAVPLITVSPADTVCFGTEIVLTTAAGLAGYAWSTGSNTATQTLTAIGTYNATVTVTDANNCSNTSAVSQVRIKAVPATPLIALAGSDNFCSNDSTKIYIVNPNSATTFTWNNIGRLSGDTNIVKLSGQYSVVADSNGCSVNGNVITINVRPLPTPVISANGPIQFCEGGSVVLFVNYTNGVTWSTGATTPSIVVNTSGEVTVTVDSLNCVATSAPVNVVSFEKPSVRAEKDTAIFGGENPLLIGIPGTTGTSPFGFEWFVRGTTDPISTSNQFAVRPENTTVYEVLLTDANGCTATDTVLVRASKEIFVPNTFSPNGDGNNDAFKVYGFGIAEIQVRIFSRTGVLVYETNRVDEIVETAIDGNSVKGWDGKYKGKDLGGEALIWHITGKLRTGEELKVKGKNSGSVFILK